MDDKSDDLPITALREPRIQLRLVDKDSLEYFEMRDSLRDHGFINSICVRPAEPGTYEVIDGLCRFTAAKEVGLALVPCIIKYHVTDEDVLAFQIRANAVSLETKPAEYANHLKRLLANTPGMTLAELACLISKRGSWVSNHLGLVNLDKETQKAVDRGEIPLANAYMLAKLPGNWKQEYRDLAATMPVNEFKPLAAGLIKQFTESVRQGKLDNFFTEKFVPKPNLRNLKMIQQELKERVAAGVICAADGCQTPLDGFYAALRWVTHMDASGLRDQEAAFKQRQRKRTSNVAID